MSKSNPWNNLQKWVQNLLNPNAKKPQDNLPIKEKPQPVSNTLANRDNSQIKEKSQPVSNTLADRDDSQIKGKSQPVSAEKEKLDSSIETIASPASSSQASFILGLDNQTDLTNLSNDRFLDLMHWNGNSHAITARVSETPIIDTISYPTTLSTEELLNTLAWDNDPLPSIKPVVKTSFAPTFLLGLDELSNLDSLSTKDLLNLIKWDADSEKVMPVNTEDFSLLEDLLGIFPE